MSHFYLPALGKAIDWENDDLRVMLVKAAHVSAQTDEFIGDFATLDECSGTGYTAGPGGSGRKALASKSVNVNNGDSRTELKAGNITWTSIAAGAGPAAAAILYRHNSGSDDNLNEAIFFYDDGGFPITFTGANAILTVPSDGMIQRQMG